MLAAVGLVALGVSGAPALAHVEVDAESVGGNGATVSFTAAGESATAGTDGIRTFLPQGIAPAGVSLASGPPGWTLKRTADGFTVSGRAVKPKENARFSVIMKLPQGVQKFTFKTVQHYSDGTVSKWIDANTAGTEAEGAASLLDLNPPKPGPVQEVTQQGPGLFGTTLSTRTWMLAGGGAAAVILIGFLWFRSRLA
jgi:hypothetical protein